MCHCANPRDSRPAQLLPCEEIPEICSTCRLLSARAREYESIGKKMKCRFITWLSLLLILLTLGGIHSVYRLTRFLWMASSEPAHKGLWMAQIYAWSAASLFLGMCWIFLLMLLVREERSAN
jgi:hypothetical protein